MSFMDPVERFDNTAHAGRMNADAVDGTDRTVDRAVERTVDRGNDRTAPALVGLSPDQIATLLAELPGGERRFRGEQVFRWLHARRAADFAAMTDLPADLRQAMAGRFSATELELVTEARSSESTTTKLVLATRDGAEIETVLIVTPRRTTVCLSSQVGCGLGCTFCRTARMGHVRNLEAGEIVDQLLHVHRREPMPERYNLVFMGMGEPLANYERVIEATDLLARPEGLAIGPRRITVSTAGLAPEIERLARERPRLKLAVSLNATTDAQRSKLMPIGRRYPLERLMRAVQFHVRTTRRRVTFEYVLLAGVNDSLEDAERLVGLVDRIPCKINLIPMNGDGMTEYSAPSTEALERFAHYLYPRTYAVTVRATQGRDILAACGQLARLPAGVDRGSPPA